MESFLKKIRKDKCLSQIDVASKVGIVQSYYCAIENGQRRPPVHTAKKIAKALDFNWQLFYPDEESTA